MEQTDNISLEPLSPVQQFAMNRVFFNRYKRPKDYMQIHSFISTFRFDTQVTYISSGEKHEESLFSGKDWKYGPNSKRLVSIWMNHKNNFRCDKLAVEGESGLFFPVKPSFIIRISRERSQYVWQLSHTLPLSRNSDLTLLSDMFAYLHPGCVSINRIGKKSSALGFQMHRLVSRLSLKRVPDAATAFVSYKNLFRTIFLLKVKVCANTFVQTSSTYPVFTLLTNLLACVA